MKSKRNSLEASKNRILRYFIVIFLSFGSILAGTIGVLYNLETNDYRGRLELEEQVNIKLQLQIIANNFEFIVTDLLFLSRQNELADLINQEKNTYVEGIANEYAELSRHKSIYDQIRFLDKTGMEIVRVNYNKGNPGIVDFSALQPKGGRYYFKDTFALGPDEIFVSPFDLNIERGEVEEPLKPMIRFGIPVLDKKNNKQGVVILNYLGDSLIKKIRAAAELSLGDIMLVNSDAYWLCSPDRKEEWGFMIQERRDRKFSSRFPDAWAEIFSSETCQIYTHDGLFTSATIYPLSYGLTSSSGSSAAFGDSDKHLNFRQYYWKIVSHIPAEKLNSATRGLLVKLFFLAILLFLLAAIPSWIIAQAIVRRKLHQMELYHSANFDNLTDLPNRAFFRDRADQTLKESKRYERCFGIMFIDLDGFKSVNDTLGHDAGDHVLLKTAERLRNCVREADTVARMGGDEFAVILTEINSKDSAETAAKKILSALSNPLKIKDMDAQVGASIGISLYPENGDNLDTLLKKADAAMYQAKKNGKNDFIFCRES